MRHLLKCLIGNILSVKMHTPFLKKIVSIDFDLYNDFLSHYILSAIDDIL